jgi:hypothetical protein
MKEKHFSDFNFISKTTEKSFSFFNSEQHTLKQLESFKILQNN